MKSTRLKVFLTVAISIVLAGAFGWKYYQPFYMAKISVKESLKDPESAQFEDMFINKNTGAICGYVNAKNSMGGYVGRKLFLVSKEGLVKFDEYNLPESLKRLDESRLFTNPLMEECNR